MRRKDVEPLDQGRRRFAMGLAGLAPLWLAGPAAFAGAVSPRDLALAHGEISPPLPLPDFLLRDSDGQRRSFYALLQRRLTAVQLIFTRCSNVCPIQGATFRQVQDLIPESKRARTQLLSLSLDPLNDTPEQLRRWLAPFRPKPGWRAASPELASLDLVLATFNQRRTDLGTHHTEVLLVDAKHRLAWRSTELPSAETIARTLSALA
ncbi:SCO family protein [Chromobacterium haemolyticum]|uniref:SCO family protein n=1 Tax=Chromobacterium haemolyticum TaxID=394935 RepID=A0ABS3GRI3_9NEIS|nr:SCO family protein [Chromobacterium haemolyticum]MBK0416292.1 SCO family protein [Chromobacterium haemolyticum]MBO0417564.1 SCO family protein [Chromobacterium haemolyticum]MBO0500678.1 SCO family protein [Chromobacterium haemolyticum]